MSWRAFRIAEHRTTLDHEQLEAQLGHRTRWQASGTCSAREACARGPVPDQTVSDQERAYLSSDAARSGAHLDAVLP
jgi:hypothetical protein